MRIDLLKEKLNKYVENIKKIRVLSAVLIDRDRGAEAYAQQLKADYSQIGKLGLECREIMKEFLYPILYGGKSCNMEMLSVLQEFCKELLEPASGEELDLTLLFEVSNYLLKELQNRAEQNLFMIQANIHVSVCYANVNRTARITSTRELTTFYRDAGLKIAYEACKWVENKELFLKLSMEARHAALRVYRFYSALFDTFYASEATNLERYQALVKAYAVCEDSFYKENIDNYDWNIHRYRCIEHMGQLTERGNRWGFTMQQCKTLRNWLTELEKLRETDSKLLESIVPEAHVELLLLRNSYFAGDIEKREYQSKLHQLYCKYQNKRYDMHSVQMNLLLPAEYLDTLRGQRITAREETILHQIYEDVVHYLAGSANMDAFNYLQEYLCAFLDVFVELPGIVTYEDIGLRCLAALHPPTYVHCLQVAQITKCLTSFLLEKHPEIFVCEFEGKSKEEILFHAYHCALCHDFGKIVMIDSIFVYGRQLFDMEYEIIKQHTRMGAQMLQKHESTKKLWGAAKWHHKWKNNQGGYPNEARPADCVMAEIVKVADCVDGATDYIGRSYSKGKTLSAILEELEQESGIRYADYVMEALENQEVLEDIRYLLAEGRKNNYRKTFQIFS